MVARSEHTASEGWGPPVSLRYITSDTEIWYDVKDILIVTQHGQLRKARKIMAAAVRIKRYLAPDWDFCRHNDGEPVIQVYHHGARSYSLK